MKNKLHPFHAGIWVMININKCMCKTRLFFVPQKQYLFKKITMTKLFNFVIAGAIATSMVGCNSATTDSKTSEATEAKESSGFDLVAAKSTIESQNAKFIETFKKGDSSGVAALYTSDAMVMPPNMESVKSNGLASFWGTMMHMGVKDLKLLSDDVAGNKDQLVETGRYELYDAQNKIMDKGKYVVVWKQENGEWKLFRDIFSSDLPAPPAK
jgi:ketosteroid isomerase-like protein